MLLTRARQGMVVFVPAGEAEDPTRDPRYYDSTFEYLVSLGLPVLAGSCPPGGATPSSKAATDHGRMLDRELP